MADLFNHRKIFELTLILAVLTATMVVVIFLADYVATNDGAQAIIARFGYAGVLAISVIAGLSTFVPIPPASFVPVFTAAGLTFPLIILTLVIGTTIADLLGYLFGSVSKDFVGSHYPRLHHHITDLELHHQNWIIPFIALYAAFSPLPNELMVIPFGVLGVPLRKILFPLILGTATHHLLVAYGAIEVVKAFIG
jgi:membrane protein YqaA with SNARE-associated domain